MKAVPLPFEEFRGKGVLDFAVSAAASDSFSLQHQQDQFLLQTWNTHKEHCYVGTEPTSVLDIRRNPSPPTSSSTLSSSHGSSSGGGGALTDTTTGAAAAKVSENNSNHHHPQEVGSERCGMGMEDWENVLSESPGQDQSIMRLIMGDIEDPAVGLSKLLQTCNGASQDAEFNNAGAGNLTAMDQGSALDPISSNNFMNSIEHSGPGAANCSDFPFSMNPNFARVVGSAVNPNNPMFPVSGGSNFPPVSLPQGIFH